MAIAKRFVLNIFLVMVVYNVAFITACNLKKYKHNIDRFVDDKKIEGYVEALNHNLQSSPDSFYSFTDNLLKSYGMTFWVTVTIEKKAKFWRATMSLENPLDGCSHVYTTNAFGRNKEETFRRVFDLFLHNFQ